ncbi:MAG: glycosyltransferase family 9 protein [Bacteroidia bacterium]|nr:glycosyltransferase family 9 protein [Bacteroidia bacterium]
MRRRFLIIRLGAIGDIVVTTTLLHGLRATWPDAHIGWLVDSRLAGMLEGVDALDRIHRWDRVGWARSLGPLRLRELGVALAALRAELRAEAYTTVLDAQGLLKSSALALLAGAPQRWVLRPREGASILAHHAVPARERIRPGDEYRDLLRALGAHGADGARMGLQASARATESARALVSRLQRSDGFVALCPFTTRPQKHWFDDRWADLTRILAACGLRCVIMGGPQDRVRAESIRDASVPGTVSIAGEAPLEISGALLALAHLTVGVDTGLTHWSMAHRVPTVALLGSALPYTTAFDGSIVLRQPMACSPCDRRPTCSGRFDCMRALGTERVAQAALTLLGQPARA